MGPADLFSMLAGLKLPERGPEVLSGLEEAEDAGVFVVGDGLALVQSVDFITPIVDDPETFGAIAAANAMSDVLLMGARPVAALGIAGFPTGKAEPSVLGRILQGAIDKLHEAGAHLLGGHTVEDREVKFGLAVTGVVDPARLIRRDGARPGDLLVLTKPVGGGIVSTALKAGVVDEGDAREMSRVMLALNDYADEMRATGVRAVTDVTGFGLVGHSLELARSSRVGVRLYWGKVPLLPRARELAATGKYVPGGSRHNQMWALEGRATFDEVLDEVDRTLACDAMTSGGLLMAVPRQRAEELVERVKRRGAPAPGIVGEVVAEHPGQVHVLP
ncbi:selenide, water dikinase SelD [Carboxydochorda subterranea]|uniref:Selenide, water dikinase SelD n=1 Tax=Carboxydichorda subterranea TaxID=3109565 RepID=A0ABZ1BZE9_9FIRM|nr:selenide, water dikinase SelD [Limnochorda sp. L945t]WRP17973.1 selenide, water dikinase SelD [Limnochorda sp. L945t]